MHSASMLIWAHVGFTALYGANMDSIICSGHPVMRVMKITFIHTNVQLGLQMNEICHNEKNETNMLVRIVTSTPALISYYLHVVSSIT